MTVSDKVLKDSLICFSLLDVSEVDRYIHASESCGLSLRRYLLQNNILTEKQILIALSQSLGLRILDFNTMTIDKEVIDKVSVKFAWYYKIIPYDFQENTLKIASARPLDVKTQDDVRKHFGCNVEVALATDKQVTEAFQKYYGFASNTIEKIIAKESISTKVLASDTGQWIEDIEKETNDPTVSNLVNQIILEAYKKRATDIHIEPYRDKVRFRYRIDGSLVDANLADNVRHFIQPILSRVKILANLSITEKRLPQDGSAVVKTNQQQLDLRVSTVPTPRGESMVIRILPVKVRLFSLEKLGFEEDDVGYFRKLISKSHGIIFITGPTGSGKTTTLYASLNEINSPETKIITIEDPIEYEMPGITQIQVNSKVGFSFSTGLRSLLRHDPDIIMVGEVRDLETAEIAIRTALTGHMVFSTLHTNDSASAVMRLIDMGVEPYLVSSSVEAFVAQRLVRVICPECKVPVKNPSPGIVDEIAEDLYIKDKSQIFIYEGAGCDYCNNTGYYGRKAIYEILNVNDTIRSAIVKKTRSDSIKKIAIRDGMKTLRQNGWESVLRGITTPNEVINVSTKDQFDDEDKHFQRRIFQRRNDQDNDDKALEGFFRKTILS